MIQYQDACSILRELATTRGSTTIEMVPLESALGRTTARSVTSPTAVPPFNNSAMDGFAVSSAWLQTASPSNPIELPIIASVFAGDLLVPASTSQPSAMEIMTGAPLPRISRECRWDTVVKVEDAQVTRAPDGKAISVTFTSPSAPGTNVREAGEDFQPGQAVLPSGIRIQPQHILALAALGISKVPVRPRCRVAIFFTGKELLHHSVDHLPFGMIRNSTRPFLEVSLPAYDADVTSLGVIGDDPYIFEKRMKNLLDGESRPFDLILSTGAVSMGQADFIGDSLRKLGADIVFHKVAIRPGKPLLCAKFADKSGPIFLGLPGNPVSTAIGARFFANTYLRALQGLPTEVPMQASLSADCRKPDGLRCFFKGALTHDRAELLVAALPGQASFMVSPLLVANSWVVFPEAGNRVARGSVVDVFPLAPDAWGFTSAARFSSESIQSRECCQ